MEAQHPARNTDPEHRHAPAPIDQTADQGPGREPSGQDPPRLSALSEPFQIFESSANGRRVITPRGELDLSNAAQLEQQFAGNIDTILDLSELSFIDSTGITLLISTAQRAQSDAWEFTVRNPQPAVLRVIKLVDLDRRLGLESQPASIVPGGPSRESGRPANGV
jgi:anti-sigma B factor antagonist